jgi:hypothetical protein
MVRALPAAIKRSISLPKASDDTDESLSLAAAGFGHLAVAAVVRDIAAHRSQLRPRPRASPLID